VFDHLPRRVRNAVNFSAAEFHGKIGDEIIEGQVRAATTQKKQ